TIDRSGPLMLAALRRAPSVSARSRRRVSSHSAGWARSVSSSALVAQPAASEEASASKLMFSSLSGSLGTGPLLWRWPCPVPRRWPSDPYRGQPTTTALARHELDQTAVGVGAHQDGAVPPDEHVRRVVEQRKPDAGRPRRETATTRPAPVSET